MRAPNALLIALVMMLAACSAPVRTLPVASVSQLSLALAATPPATATPLPAAKPLASPPITGAPAGASSPAAAKRANAASASATPFNIGVPAGDAYYPYSIAIDPARNLAYVYHANSAEKRPVISVVDLVKGQVTRLIRVVQASGGSSGRLFLTTDGKRLLLQENQDYTFSTVDAVSGALRKILDGVHDAVLSEDGRVLYAAHDSSVAAYLLADLVLGRSNPIWQLPGRFQRLAVNAQHLLATTYGETGALVSLDAGTGKEVARGDAPDPADGVAAGPDGGWAITVGGETASLVRYDAGLKKVGQTGIIYTSDLTYDPHRNRYLVGGQRYSEAEPRGHPVVIAVNAGDGKVAQEERWSGESAPSVFVPWGGEALVAFASGGPAILDVVDPAKLSSRTRIPTGAAVEDLLIDDGAGVLYVADDLGRIHVLKLPDGNEVAVWEGRTPFALDRANGRLYVNRSDGLVALDTRNGASLAQFPQRGHPAPDPNADLVYITDRGVTMYDRSGKKLGTLPSTFPVEHGFVPNPSAYAALVNPVTGHVGVILDNGIPGSNGGSYVRIFPRRSDKGVQPTAPHSAVMDLTTDSQGNWYVAYSTIRNQDAVQVLTPDGKELRRLDHRTGNTALEEEKDDLYLFQQGRATRLQASTLTATDVFQAPEDGTKMAFSPSRGTAYLAGFRGPAVTPVDLKSLEPLDLSPVPGRPSTDSSNGGLGVVSDGSKRLVVAQFSEPYRTADGAAWQRLLPGTAMLWSNVTAVSPQTIFVTGQSHAGAEGVWRSKDGGNTWEFMAAGLTDLSMDGGVRANSADEAYVVNRGQGLLRWDPAGQKWQVVSVPEPQGQWGPLSLAPDGTLFRSNGGTLERSSDRGSTWTKLGSSENTGDVIGYSALYTVTHTLFSVVRSNYRITGLQRSTDGGKTWKPSITGAPMDFDGYQPELVSGFGRTYLLLQPYNGASSLLRTIDYGDTWQSAPAGTVDGVAHIAIDPVDGRLWLGVKGGVRSLQAEKLKWTDAGSGKGLQSRTSTPTATPASTPSRTPAPTATTGPCRQPLTGNDAEINQRNLGLGCPKRPAENIQMARQRFQNGQMIWRQDLKWIYVLYTDGRWEGYSDRWAEVDPVDNPALVPPAGLQQPARGFGKVWRENLGGQKAPLGWALEKEQGILGQAQDWEYGTVLRFGGEAIILFDRGAWR